MERISYDRVKKRLKGKIKIPSKRDRLSVIVTENNNVIMWVDRPVNNLIRRIPEDGEKSGDTRC